MLTSRRMLSLLLAAAAVIAILSGCYAAPVNEATEQGGETSGAIVTDSKIPVTTYPVPGENVRAFAYMAASASTGGFWQWNTFFRPYIQAYDPVTRTTYVPCYQSGCLLRRPAVSGGIPGKLLCVGLYGRRDSLGARHASAHGWTAADPRKLGAGKRE